MVGVVDETLEAKRKPRRVQVTIGRIEGFNVDVLCQISIAYLP